MVKEFPWQRLPLFTVIIGNGAEIAVILVIAGDKLMHPSELEPTTEYVAEIVGLIIGVPP